VCMEVPDALADEAIAFLGQLMTRPVPELQGLRIGCEIETGRNWGSYDEKKPDKNPNGMRAVKAITTLEEEFAIAA